VYHKCKLHCVTRQNLEFRLKLIQKGIPGLLSDAVPIDTTVNESFPVQFVEYEKNLVLASPNRLDDGAISNSNFTGRSSDDRKNINFERVRNSNIISSSEKLGCGQTKGTTPDEKKSLKNATTEYLSGKSNWQTCEKEHT
jgi:hypothetical protein